MPLTPSGRAPKAALANTSAAATITRVLAKYSTARQGVSPSPTGLPSSSNSTDWIEVSEALTLYESKW